METLSVLSSEMAVPATERLRNRSVAEKITSAKRRVTPPSLAQLSELAIRGLSRRLRGYTLKEVKTTYEVDPQGERRVKSEVVVRKQVAPDLAALTFVLTNLDPQHWRAERAAGRPEEEIEQPDLSSLSEQTLRELSGLWDEK